MFDNHDHHRKIRSYVRREGRITPAQQKALNTLFPKLGVKLEHGLVDFAKEFNRNGEIILEIGFGMGEALVEIAKQNPDDNFIGIEVYRPGVGSCLNLLYKKDIQNVRIFCDDAVTVLEEAIPSRSLTRVQIFFPDPWPKKRHHKRRLIQPEFIKLVGDKLKNKGILHLATDCDIYALHMLEVLEQKQEFHNMAGENEFYPRPKWRPKTKFEKRGEKLTHQVYDLLFEFNNPSR